MSPPPSAAVVAVGDELLFGATVNTNGAWLSRELSDLGLSVCCQGVVGDKKDQISAVVGKALDEVELVIVTGGLGPTHDDLTREAVAELLGLPLDLNEDLLGRLKQRFEALGYETPPQGSEAMATIPRGGRILTNPLGAAPGLALEVSGDRLCVLLPGIPREMRAIFDGDLTALLLDRFARRLQPVVHRSIPTTGVPESVLAAEIAELIGEDLGPVSLAFLPDLRGVRLRLSARAGPEDPEMAVALGHIERVEGDLEPVLRGRRYFGETGDLAEAVGQALLEEGSSLAVAESCTGGLIAKRVTDQPGSSRYFLGGIVAYANEIKTDHLGVPPGVLRDHGAVSREVAEAMASGVAAALGARFGIGITGIAGPDGGTSERPVGTVWYAVFSDRETVARRASFLGGREDIRERAAQAALNLLLRVLEDRRP